MAKATPSYAKQVLWSLLAAAVITVATIALVTAKIGPGLDSRELRGRQELIEDQAMGQQRGDGGTGSRSVGRPARSGWRSRRTRS